MRSSAKPIPQVANISQENGKSSPWGTVGSRNNFDEKKIKWWWGTDTLVTLCQYIFKHGV